MYKPQTATLLITFNRPDYTEKVLDQLRVLQIPRLYIFKDGPRPNNNKDIEAHGRIIDLIHKIDWECDVRTFISEVNLGCGMGVSGAITWAFDTEDRLIILEDDCIPSPAFYPFCDTILDRYRDDNRIWVVCGENHDYPVTAFSNSDYIFSQFGFNWGWATWKRCWDRFDIQMKDLDDFKRENRIESSFTDPAIAQTYKRMYDRLTFNRAKPEFWTAQFGFQIVSNRGYFVIPRSNLIRNIGESGDHTTKASRYVNVATDDSFQVKMHPRFVLHDHRIDLEQYRIRIKPMIDGLPLIKRVVRKAKKVMGKN